MSAVQSLRHLGVEDLVLPLPKIVVVGDQSTGKSSLIEGMSEIKVPRASGTCTRCPLEINLTEGQDDWTCSVSIHKRYMYTGALGTSKAVNKSVMRGEGASRAKPLGPWALQNSEHVHFATVSSPSQVEEVLYLAQLAILNPSTSHDHFLPTPGKAKPPQMYAVKFSPNIIQLDISGRGLPNLSFYDLPGVINVSDIHEEAYLVDLVKNLVKEYITQDDCINLLAIPMSDDPANSSAARLIREAKAGPRTLGCLTKPDRLQKEESLLQWEQLLRGERFQLGHGYHVVKNNADTTVDHKTAREEEAEFFRVEEPWSTTLRSYHRRFGTIQLQTILSRLLTIQIQNALPRIREQVEQKADSIEAGLRALPEPLSENIPAVVMGELLKFQQEVQMQVDGGAESCLFQKSFNDFALGFRQSLATTRPRIVWNTRASPRKQQLRESPNGSIASTPTPMSRNRHQTPIMLSDDEMEDDVPSQPSSGQKRSRAPHSEQRPNKSFKMEDGEVRANVAERKTFSLGEIRATIRNTYIGLPGQIHPKATEKMIRTSMSHWQHPVNELLSQTKELCDYMVDHAVQTAFGDHVSTAYFDKIFKECQSFLSKTFDDQRVLSHRILNWENSKPKTLNVSAMGKALEEAKELLRVHRRKALATAYVEEQERKSGNQLPENVKQDRINKVPDDKLPAEQYGPEIHAMAVGISLNLCLTPADNSQGSESILRMCLCSLRRCAYC